MHKYFPEEQKKYAEMERKQAGLAREAAKAQAAPVAPVPVVPAAVEGEE